MRNKHTSILISVSILSTLLALFIVNSTNTVSDISYGEVHIVTDTVWDLANGTYYIEGNVTVDFGINLTIEPGVMVLFNGPYSLYIEGNLTALGNAANMIKFTSNFTTPQRGDWNRIQVNATGYAEIIYCNITYARTAINLNESSRNDVHNNLISNNLNGIELFKSSSNIISNNNITYNEHSGVFIEESINNTLSGNNISKSVRQGVQIYLGSTNNTVSDNNIFQNGWAGLNLYKNSGNIYLSNEIHDNIHGIDTYESFSNEFRYNNIYSNFLSGISLSRSNDNVITNNNISFNGYDGSGTGIYLSSSVNNSVFHNTIIDNEEQAFDDEDTNIWDDGYPYGGNFWSDYNGSDDKRGPYQDVPGSDGIGDTNYSIDSDSFDNFPLMNITLNVAPLFIILSSPANNSIISEGTLIDFDILLENPPFVNYSKNGESNVTFFDPYQIVTTGWDDGDCTIEVFVVDERGNVNSSWFFFVIDSERPIIELVSPSNNSIIAAQAIIDISIIEPNIKSVFYILNNDSVWDLLFPYDINCSTWSEGDYWIEVHAEDLAGNKNSSVYAFTVDLLPPRIVLLSPLNNSYIKPGIFINVSITDMHLDPTTAYYIVDGNSDTFSTPFLIDTSSWQDDNYKVEVVAFDTLGHSATQFYNITVDSQPPSLVLNYPHNNSVIAAGVTLNFSASDVNPLTFRYYTDILGGEDIFPPYDIDTSTWKDRDYIIEVNVSDSAGNFNLSLFQFSIDSSKPEIILRDPSNNSSITSGTPIAFEIDEPHISFANYSVDGGEFQDLLSVMIIDTTGWQ
ncbi:MAG: right-handed parallel beta-helix repeat-containing protein, partial [Thermoplasmata archaeon]